MRHFFRRSFTWIPKGYGVISDHCERRSKWLEQRCNMDNRIKQHDKIVYLGKRDFVFLKSAFEVFLRALLGCES